MEQQYAQRANSTSVTCATGMVIWKGTTLKGSRIVLGIMFFRFGILFGFVFLPVFLAICSILELEADISTVARTVQVTW